MQHLHYIDPDIAWRRDGIPKGGALTHVSRTILFCSCYDLARFGSWQRCVACLPSSPQALPQVRRSEEPVSRSETLQLIEIELTRARKMAEGPGDEVLRYLIDMAILEATSKNDSRGGSTDSRREFSTPMSRNKAN
jgi:hypothetical protein